jgi:hypothetical protein
MENLLFPARISGVSGFASRFDQRLFAGDIMPENRAIIKPLAVRENIRKTKLL